MTKPLILSIVVPVFNDAIKLDEMLTAFVADRFRRDDVEIIVVDDGSDHPIAVDQALGRSLNLTLIRNDVNQGRGCTRNAGAKRAQGNYLLFLDADCIPAMGFVTHALEHIGRKEVLVFGHIRFISQPFLEFFENNVQSKRAANLDQWHLIMTTASVLIHGEIFNAVGGYLPLYKKYGMEDRDLLIRIHERFPGLEARYSHAMAVSHTGEISTLRYVNKFIECGKYSVPVFRARHPEAYRRMSYSVFDYRFNAWIGWIPHPVMAFLTGWLLSAMMVCYPKLSNYRFKAMGLKLLKGVALLKGTVDSTP